MLPGIEVSVETGFASHYGTAPQPCRERACPFRLSRFRRQFSAGTPQHMHRRGFNVSLKIRAAQPTKNAFPFEGKVSAEPTDEVEFKSVRRSRTP